MPGRPVSDSTNPLTSGAGFIAIGKHVYLRPGQTSSDAVTDDSTTKGPTVILIFGWMSAQLPHLHKYTQYYSEVYPQATQILVRNQPSLFFSTEKANESVLAPVVGELEAAGCIAPSKPESYVDARKLPRVLVHVFSNGGALALTTLGRMLAQRPSPPQRLASAIVLDSCPGNDDIGPAIKALTASTPNPLARLAIVLLLLLMTALAFLRRVLFGRPTMFTVLRAALLRPRVVPWADERSPRLYICSKSDELVPWQQVVAHAELAKGAGIDVRVKLYEQTPHVAHMRADPGSYWAAIGEVWGDAWRAAETEGSVVLEN